MALEVGDPSSSKGFDFLQRHLEARSYISGFSASQNDVKVFSAMKCEPADTERYPDVIRWYRHIGSYGPEGRKAFPEAVDQVIVLRDPERFAKKEEVRLLGRCVDYDWFIWHSSVSLLVAKYSCNRQI